MKAVSTRSDGTSGDFKTRNGACWTFVLAHFRDLADLLKYIVTHVYAGTQGRVLGEIQQYRGQGLIFVVKPAPRLSDPQHFHVPPIAGQASSLAPFDDKDIHSRAAYPMITE